MDNIYQRVKRDLKKRYGVTSSKELGESFALTEAVSPYNYITVLKNADTAPIKEGAEHDRMMIKRLFAKKYNLKCIWAWGADSPGYLYGKKKDVDAFISNMPEMHLMGTWDVAEPAELTADMRKRFNLPAEDMDPCGYVFKITISNNYGPLTDDMDRCAEVADILHCRNRTLYPGQTDVSTYFYDEDLGKIEKLHRMCSDIIGGSLIARYWRITQPTEMTGRLRDKLFSASPWGDVQDWL